MVNYFIDGKDSGRTISLKANNLEDLEIFLESMVKITYGLSIPLDENLFLNFNEYFFGDKENELLRGRNLSDVCDVKFNVCSVGHSQSHRRGGTRIFEGGNGVYDSENGLVTTIMDYLRKIDIDEFMKICKPDYSGVFYPGTSGVGWQLDQYDLGNEKNFEVSLIYLRDGLLEV